MSSISPVTSVGIAIGRSTTAESTRRPANRYRTSTHARSVPITPLIRVATADVIRVNRIADHAPGTASAVRNDVSPSPNPSVTIAATGINTIAPR